MRLFRSLINVWIEDERASPIGNCLRFAGFALLIIPFGLFGPGGRLFLLCVLLGLAALVEHRFSKAAGWISAGLLLRAWGAWRTAPTYTIVCAAFALLLIGVALTLSAQQRRSEAAAREWKMP